MTRSATLRPRLWDGSRQTLAGLLALLAPLIVRIVGDGASRLEPLAMALLLAALWQLAFARLRQRPAAWDGIVTAVTFAILLPITVPLWQQGLALSFGLVLGDLVFGGRGHGFLNPCTVCLAFLLFSFPVQDTVSASVPAFLVAALVGGALLVGAGILSWRIVVGFGVTYAALTLSWPMQGTWPDWDTAVLVFGLVFLIGDPVAAACTNAGRWLYGSLAGGLVVMLSQAGGDGLASLVFAALLSGILAPLIDQAVIWANVRRRTRRSRHG